MWVTRYLRNILIKGKSLMILTWKKNTLFFVQGKEMKLKKFTVISQIKIKPELQMEKNITWINVDFMHTLNIK